MKKRLFKILLMATVLWIGCSSCENKKMNSSENKEVDAVEALLDSLQKIYAPDKRVDLWMFELEEEEGNFFLKGKVYNEKAFNDLNEQFKARFPKIKVELELLPSNEKERVVNAIITNSVATIRGEGRHSAEIVTQLLMGTPVKILKDEGSWILIQAPNRYIGWAYSYEIKKLTPDEMTAYKQSDKRIYTSQGGFSYSEANTESRVVSDLALGCMFSVLDSVGDFYKVQYADKREAFVRKDETISVKLWLKSQPIAEKLTKTAEKFMGLPYLWGGTSAKAIDCSGFSSSIYFMHGILLQRDASQQTHYGKLVDTQKDFSQLAAGDLVFFGRQATDSLPEKVTHVGMYIGDTEFIHASGKVRINSFDASRANFDQDYVNSFIRARRIINQVDNKGIERIEDNLFYKEIFQ